VVEDTAHVYETTMAALEGFAQFVPDGGFFVVEDTVCDVDELRLEGAPHGALHAVRRWLSTPVGKAFVVRDDLELYGFTGHPGGFLQRRVPSSR
jgi:cephalosporin hydroxylase